MNDLAESAGTRLAPRRLILEMLDADPALMGSGRRLVAAGDVFGFSENQVRVALSRLLAERMLEQPRRGDYALGPGAKVLHREIQGWRTVEDRMQAWSGNWSGILTDNLAAEGSTRFRAQSRALALRGLRRWRPGLWVRPDNLQGGTARLWGELEALGLDAMKGQCLISEGDSHCEESLRSLWDTGAMEAGYRQRIEQLTSANERLDDPDVPAVLMETIELGGDTIRELLRDPLLPDEIASGEQRRELIRTLDRYDQRGREQWQRLIQQL